MTVDIFCDGSPLTPPTTDRTMTASGNHHTHTHTPHTQQVMASYPAV